MGAIPPVAPVVTGAARHSSLFTAAARSAAAGQLLVGGSLKRLGIALFAFATIACKGATNEPVLIGAAGPWHEGYGAQDSLGIQLAMDEINAAGGVRGRQLKVVFRNDSASGSWATAVAQAFVSDAGVLAVVGHMNSGAMMSAARIYDGKLAAVAVSATAADLSGISPWAFRVSSSDSTNGADMARFANARGHRRAAILYENDSYGRGLAEQFRRNFRGDVVSIDPIFDAAADFEPFVTFYARSNADVIFVASTEDAGLAFLREVKRQGLTAAVIGGDGWTGLVRDPATAAGAFVGAPFTPADARPEVRRFVDTFRSRFGRDPDANAALGYDATRIVAAAIEQAGMDRRAIRNRLASLDERSAHRGVTGTIYFAASGDPVGKGIVMTRVQGAVLMPEASQ